MEVTIVHSLLEVVTMGFCFVCVSSAFLYEQVEKGNFTVKCNMKSLQSTFVYTVPGQPVDPAAAADASSASLESLSTL